MTAKAEAEVEEEVEAATTNRYDRKLWKGSENK